MIATASRLIFRRFSRCFLAAVLGAFWLGNPCAAHALATTDFQTIDAPNAFLDRFGTGTFITGISGGSVVGYYTDKNGLSHGFFFNGSTYTTLDDPNAILNNVNTGGTAYTWAMGISGNEIVGYYLDANLTNHGFLYNGTGYSTLDDPNAAIGSTGGTVAENISDSNIVGFFRDGNRTTHGFLYTHGQYTTLDDPFAGSGYGKGTWINSIIGGNIVGYYIDNYFISHGFLYDGTTYTTIDDPINTNLNLLTSGTVLSGLSGGNIVGYYFDANNDIHNFLYIGGNFTNLYFANNGTSFQVNDISDNTIVGSYLDSQEQSHGFSVALVAGVNYAITVIASPSAGGTVNGGGNFPLGNLQTVTASANDGYSFGNWTMDGVEVGSSTNYIFNINSNVDLIANFIANEGTDAISYQTIDFPDGNGGISRYNSIAHGISGDSIIGSYCVLGDGVDYSNFYYNGSIYVNLNVPNASVAALITQTYPNGISGGRIVGDYYDDKGNAHGFLYDSNTYLSLDDPSATVGLGPYGGTYPQGIYENNIVGYYTDGNGTHGFLYDGSTYITLDDPNAPDGTYLTGISDGNIVGYYADENGVYHGFLYERGIYMALDDPNAADYYDFTYGPYPGGTWALGISNGKVIGYYMDYNGVSHGFIATIVHGVSSITPPSVPAPLMNQTGIIGKSVHFAVMVGGSGPFTYQWQFNGKNIVGAMSATLTIPKVAAGNAGSYDVVISGPGGSVTSQPATLKVLKSATKVKITTQPKAMTVKAGKKVKFTVKATGTPPLLYQWQKNNANLADGGEFSGSAKATLTIVGVIKTDAGKYRVIVTNPAGKATSTAAKLTVK